MRKFHIVGLVILAFLIVGLAIADQVTFSTYYPAPAGVYNQMNTRTFGVGDNNGDGLINNNDGPDPTTNPGDAWIAGNVGIGTTEPLSTATAVPNGLASNLDVNDVWLRGADGGNGAWASTGGGGEFDPSTYTGGQSITFPNGLILKHGIYPVGGPATVTFGIPFPNAAVSVSVTPVFTNGTADVVVKTASVSKTGFQTWNNMGWDNFYWQAWGY